MPDNLLQGAGEVPGRSRPAPPRVVIRPSAAWRFPDLAELWAYRELIYFLTWRDIKVRYKQTVLGAAWAIIQPFMTMVVFSLFFGKLAKVPSDGIPYPIFSYAALVPWTFFSGGLAQSSNSLVGSANLITKVYFPRLIVPLSKVFAGLVDFAIAFLINAEWRGRGLVRALFIIPLVAVGFLLGGNDNNLFGQIKRARVQ